MALTGELTLHGKILRTHGIKEKVLAAKRSGLKEIIMCAQNEKDVNEIDAAFIKGVTFHYVKTMQQVVDLALV
jgi:ATP-dependent Lon protease